MTDEKAWRKVMKDGAVAAAGGARSRRCAGVEPFEPEPIEDALARCSAEREVKPGKLYQPIRVAISGTTVSPGIFESLAVLGKDRSLERIERRPRKTPGNARRRAKQFRGAADGSPMATTASTRAAHAASRGQGAAACWPRPSTRPSASPP